jgi:hypothetical protein
MQKVALHLKFPMLIRWMSKESERYLEENAPSWWYEFRGGNDNTLTIEIEAYSEKPSLPEHFHHTLTLSDDEEEDEGNAIVFEGLEFKKLSVGGIEFTKCKLRLLAVGEDRLIEPLMLCDYLFVNDQYGFTISWMQRNENGASMETLMKQLLSSIHFPKK